MSLITTSFLNLKELDLQECESNPEKYVHYYSQLKAEEEKEQDPHKKEFITHIVSFFFEKLNVQFKKQRLCLSSAAISSEWVEKNIEVFTYRVSELLQGAIGQNEEFRDELRKVIYVSRSFLKQRFDPDLTLLSGNGESFMVWRGLLFEGDYFAGALSFSTENTLNLKCSNEALRAFRIYLEMGNGEEGFPEDRETLEELHNLARFWMMPNLQEICSQKLLQFEESLLQYLIEAYSYREWNWLEAIIERFTSLNLGLCILQRINGRIELTLQSWDETVKDLTFALSEIIEEISFDSADILIQFILSKPPCFPHVKAIDLSKCLLQQTFPESLLPEIFPNLAIVEVVTEDLNTWSPYFPSARLVSLQDISFKPKVATTDDELLYILLHSPSLTNLILTSNQITDRGLHILSCYCTDSPTLSFNSSWSTTPAKLSSHAKSILHLTRLTFDSMDNINDETLYHFASSAWNFHSITLSNCNHVSMNGVMHFSSRSLTSLGINGCKRIEGKDIENFLERFTSVSSLDVRQTPALFYELCLNILTKKSSIQTFQSDHVQLERDSLLLRNVTIQSSEELEAVLSVPKKVNALCLNNVKAPCEEYLFSVIFGFQELVISDCDVSEAFLAPLIKHSPYLQVLQLKNCKEFNTEALIKLTKSIKKLAYLSIENCSSITTDIVFQMIENAPLISLEYESLTEKDLDYLKMHHPSIRALRLSNCTHLTFSALCGLNLQRLTLVKAPDLTDEDLIQILEKNPRLRYLSVADCPKITDKLVDFLQKMPSLEIFTYMGMIGLTHARLNALRTQCPKLKIRYWKC